MHHEEWWRIVLGRPQAAGARSHFPRKGKGVQDGRCDERQAGMMVECRALGSRCRRSTRVDAATVVARRARLARPVLSAVGVVLAGLLVPVTRGQLGSLRATLGAVAPLICAPTDRPAASGKDEQRDQEPGDSPSPAGAEGGHELQAGPGSYSRLSPRAPGVLRPWPVAGFTAWALPCEAVSLGSGEDGPISGLGTAWLRPGAEGPRLLENLPRGGASHHDLGDLGAPLHGDSPWPAWEGEEAIPDNGKTSKKRW